MCKALHLAAERELPLVPWDENHRGFNVVVATTHELERVKQHFTLAQVAYAGSHTGCSCGFCWDEGGAPLEMLEFDEEEKVCTKDLLRYLAEVLKSSKVVEAYGCWEGDWNFPPLGSEWVVSVSAAMEQECFVLPERVRIRFVK